MTRTEPVNDHMPAMTEQTADTQLPAEVKLPPYLYIVTVDGSVQTVKGLSEIHPRLIKDIRTEARDLDYEQMEGNEGERRAPAYWLAETNGGDGESSIMIWDTAAQNVAQI